MFRRDYKVFGYYVNDPERFGIVEFDEFKKVISVEEKPKNPKSNYAITGLYFYPPGVSKFAKKVKPSERGELEITTLNEMYLKQENLNVELLGRGFALLFSFFRLFFFQVVFRQYLRNNVIISLNFRTIVLP